jgi:hypothetical protein
VFGIGFWNVTDPQHPEYQPISRTSSRTSFRYMPGSFDTSDSSEGSDTVSAHSAISVQSVHKPNSPAVEKPVASIYSITSTFGPTNVNAPTENPDIDMSANVTTVAPVHTPSSNRLKGTAPTVFTGNQSRSESFWNEFCRYRLLNCNNDSISIMDTQVSIGPYKSSSAITGGHSYVVMSKITYKDALTVSATKSITDQPRRL